MIVITLYFQGCLVLFIRTGPQNQIRWDRKTGNCTIYQAIQWLTLLIYPRKRVLSNRHQPLILRTWFTKTVLWVQRTAFFLRIKCLPSFWQYRVISTNITYFEPVFSMISSWSKYATNMYSKSQFSTESSSDLGKIWKTTYLTLDINNCVRKQRVRFSYFTYHWAFWTRKSRWTILISCLSEYVPIYLFL